MAEVPREGILELWAYFEVSEREALWEIPGTPSNWLHVRPPRPRRHSKGGPARTIYMEISSQAVQGLGCSPRLTGNFCSNPKTPIQLGLLTRCNGRIHSLKEKKTGKEVERGERRGRREKKGGEKGKEREKKTFSLVLHHGALHTIEKDLPS